MTLTRLLRALVLLLAIAAPLGTNSALGQAKGPAGISSTSSPP
jgi:hypothetical protein